MTRTLTREARLQTLSFTLGTARGMIQELGTVDAGPISQAAREDPARWGPLVDSLAATTEPGPGTLVAVLAALSGVLDG
jgi:hypothetical protein